jgi:hypothetical protein
MPAEKKYKFPRRFSKAHCMSKSCDKMGFTEKASCRPYKNCYHKGGAPSRKNKSTKSNNHRSTVKASNHPHMTYTSTHTTFTSHPAKGEPFGVRTTVSLKNGTGTKKVESLNKNGKTMKSKSAPIHNTHCDQIKNGKYVPGLWNM